VPWDEFGASVAGVLEKKLRIDPFFDVALEFCFWREGGARAGVAVEESSFLAMIATQ
jgi:hypothetical protein